MTETTVAVRMYRVGFGDAFLITLTQTDLVWRMLVDCGVHSQGAARPIHLSVQAIIEDLRASSTGGVPRIDVIAATHHHADHISGFACDDWESVEVGEVWLPFVEDPADSNAIALRNRQTVVAKRLLTLIEDPATLGAHRFRSSMDAPRALVINALGNDDATDRLLGRNGRHFANKPHRVRFLPSTNVAENTIRLGIDGATIHVLGPSRDPEELKRMEPPTSVAWFQIRSDGDLGEGEGPDPLFRSDYVVSDRERIPLELREARELIDFSLDDEVLTAASILECAVNNTSLFFVLDVLGTRLIFPGDAQHGAWQHVLSEPHARTLLTDAVFYKIGHHGSGNATPRDFVEHTWQDGGFAMLPWGLVRRWIGSIPDAKLLSALSAHHTIVRADAPRAVPAVTVQDDLWSEVTFSVGTVERRTTPE